MSFMSLAAFWPERDPEKAALKGALREALRMNGRLEGEVKVLRRERIWLVEEVENLHDELRCARLRIAEPERWRG